MNPSLLTQLAPDHAPPPLGWWPLAPGWWGLMALLLLAALALVWLHRRRQAPSSRRWQRTALRELAVLQTQPGLDDAQLAQGLQLLLRRYAVARYGHEAVAALSGEAWIAFVVRRGGQAWAGDSGLALLRCAYGRPGTETAASRSAHRKRWLQGARGFLRDKKLKKVGP